MITLHPSSMNLSELSNTLHHLLEVQTNYTDFNEDNKNEKNQDQIKNIDKDKNVEDLELLTIHTGLICPSFEPVSY